MIIYFIYLPGRIRYSVLIARDYTRLSQILARSSLFGLSLMLFRSNNLISSIFGPDLSASNAM